MSRNPCLDRLLVLPAWTALTFASSHSLAVTYPAWAPDTCYVAGTVVSDGGRLYRALVSQTDYGSTGWNPTVTSLWTDIGPADGDTSPPPPPPPPPGGGLTEPDARSANQAGRVYSGYDPSWSDTWFDATGKSLNEVFRASQFARIPANYRHVMVAFAQPNFSWGGLVANNWSGTGINFNGRPSDIKAAVEVLHARNMKVVLAVGGATYNSWAQLSAEGHGGGGATINAFA